MRLALPEHLAAFPARPVTLPWREPEGQPVTARLGAPALDQLTARDRGTLAAALPALQRFAAQLEEPPERAAGARHRLD